MRWTGLAAWLLYRRRAIAAVVGTCSLLTAGLVAFLPAVLPVDLIRPLAIRVLGDGWPVVALGVLAGALGARSLHGATTERARTTEPWLPDQPPEEGRASGLPTAGDGIDRGLTSFDPEPAESGWDRRRRKRAVRSRIHETAVAAVAEADGIDREAAARRIESGAWTDRPRARAYLGGTDAAEPPLALRIRDWASGEAYDRAVGETVAVVAEYAGVETEGEWA